MTLINFGCAANSCIIPCIIKYYHLFFNITIKFLPTVLAQRKQFLEGLTFSRDFAFLTPALNYVNIICDLVFSLFCLLVAAQFAKKNDKRNERESGEEKDGTQEVADAQIPDLIIIP
jgi:hypothetical protein